jgi:predicted permease
MRLERWLYVVPLKLRSLFRRRQVDRELDEELQYHLERKIEERVARGLTPEEARYAALRDMQGIEQRKEECRDMRGMNGIDNLFQDLRYGCRMLAKNRGFAAVAILTLALGIGANTAMFTVVNSVLLRPLDYPEPDRIVQLLNSTPNDSAKGASTPRFIVWRQQARILQDVVLYDWGGRVNLTGDDHPEQLRDQHVSDAYFRLFGAQLDIGRTFTAQEDRPGGPHLVVMSNGLWRRRFGSDRGLLGKTILLGGEARTVIGVLAASFSPDVPTDVWFPMQADANSTNHAAHLRAAARLKPGITLEMARAQMKLAENQFRQKFPELNGKGPDRFEIEPLQEAMVGDVRPPLLILLGAVSLVLLIACANVANLLLARANGRTRELAIRSALGAGRRRIICQLLAESLLLSSAGGVLGVILGLAALRALLAISPADIPRIGVHGAVVLDWRVLVGTLFLSLLTAVLFALLPGFGASRAQVSAALQESGARSGAGVRQKRIRALLVITEIALSLVLSASATALIRTFVSLRTVDPGFETSHVLTMEMSLAGAGFTTNAVVSRLVREGVQRVENIPGVSAAAITYCLPLETRFFMPFTLEGQPPTTGLQTEFGAQWRPVSTRYFEVFRIAARRGRVFTERDDLRSAGVVVINEAMARQFWPRDNPIGKQITIGRRIGPEFEEPPRQIIGVVADVRDTFLNQAPEPIMYVPTTQGTDALTALGTAAFPIIWVVRTKVDPYSLSGNIQKELRIASGGLPLGRIRSMDQVTAGATASANFNMVLMGIFAAIALFLAAIGIYGVMAYAVQERTREISIRMVLGAESKEVRGMVLMQGMRLAIAGVFLGLVIACGLMPMMASLLFGVKPLDPAVLASVAVGISTIAALAIYIPARRATAVDPVLALRWE